MPRALFNKNKCIFFHCKWMGKQHTARAREVDMWRKQATFFLLNVNLLLVGNRHVMETCGRNASLHIFFSLGSAYL